MTRPLRTDRLVLRAHDERDVAAVRDLYSLAAVQRYLGDGTGRVRTHAQAREKIRGWHEAYGEDPALGVWAVTGPAGVVLGTLLLKPIPDSGTGRLRDIEIGWHFHPEHWGQGYATEAARAVLAHGFAAGLDRVVAVTNPANAPSRAVCARLGMRHVGLSNTYYDAACELYEITAARLGGETTMEISPDLIRGEDGLLRPRWAAADPLLREYYDIEWGMPVRDEPGMFERVALEAFQAGLSWRTVLAKRPAFREVFHGFDPDAVAAFGDADVDRLMSDPRIIRNRRKILATVANARATVALREDGGLVDLIWSFQPETTPEPWHFADVPTESKESAALSKELKRRGFSFVGPTTMYAMMEAIGVVDTHLMGSHRRGTSGVWSPAE